MSIRARVAAALTALAAAASLAFASPASAEFCQGATIQVHAAWTWETLFYSFTDYSYWLAGSAPYDAARLDGDNFVTWTVWMQSGGSVDFDNGTFSPHRRTAMYNNGTVQYQTYFSQSNFNGSCH